MEKNASTVKKQTFKKAGKAVLWAAAALACAAVVWLLFCSVTGRLPSLFGYGVVRIKSGSMEPKIHTGDFILIKKTAPEKIKVGDIITFRSDDPAILDKPNTHEVVEILQNGKEFVTKGKANLAKDAYTAKAKRLYGRYVTTLGTLTAFFAFLTLPYVFWPGIGFVLGLTILFTVKDAQENKKAVKDKAKEALLQKERNRLRQEAENDKPLHDENKRQCDDQREKKGGFDDHV